MVNQLKPYEEYKETGLLWVDKVPSHWELTRNKKVMKLKKEVVGSEHDKYTLLSLTLKGIIARDMKNPKGKFPKDFSTYQTVDVDNLVFCLFDIDETPRTVGLSPLQGMITGAYTTFRVINNTNAKYLYYYYLSLDQNKSLKPLYTGLRKVISNDTFLRTSMPLPPRIEQNQIVRYLDHQLAKINKFINIKKKLIPVLKEQKQALINEAVTKGVNPGVNMKTSGIEWLGKIPEHWDISRCKYLFSEVDERSEYGNEIHLSMTQKSGLIPSNELEGRRLLSENYIGAKVCKKEDLVLNRLKAHLGVFGLSPQLGLVSPDYTVLRTTNLIYPKFGEYVLKSQACRGELFKRVRGIVEGFWRLYTDDFYNIVLPLPSYSEQKSIICHLETKLNQIDSTVRKTQHEIELIMEYRTRLIADVVTGKVDVRHIKVDVVQEDELNIEDTDEETVEL